MRDRKPTYYDLFFSGKSFITMTGEVAAVRAAVSAGEKKPEAQGMLSESVVIPSPHPDIINTLY